jgi:hypothetical protein
MVEVAFNIMATTFYICAGLITAAFTTLLIACMAYGSLKATKDYAEKK